MDDNWKGRAGDIFGHPLLQIAASGQELLKHVK